MGQVTVTLSSVGNTRAIALDWMNGAPVAVAVTGSTSSSFAYTVQYTMDDVMLTAASAVTWISDPGATALTSNSSGIYNYVQPIAGIRLASTTLSSGALTFKVTQGMWL